MKRILMILLILAMVVLLCSCGETQYDRDSKSGWEKFTHGDFDSMTSGERKAVNDFFEWQDKRSAEGD